MKASANAQPRALTWPVTPAVTMPLIIAMLRAMVRALVRRVRPSAISPAARQFSRVEAGMPSAITRTNSSASARPSEEKPPTSLSIHHAPIACSTSISSSESDVKATVNDASRCGASPFACHSRCIGIRTAGTPSLCRNASGNITALTAPRKLSATSDAPMTCAIRTSRAKARTLLTIAPPIRMAVRLRLTAHRAGRWRAAAALPAPRRSRTGSRIRPP